jgi:hypothetical protein
MGDLDNDGDIDLAISGLDTTMFSVFIIENNKENSLKELKFMDSDNEYEFGFINGDLKIVDVDLDGTMISCSMKNCFRISNWWHCIQFVCKINNKLF